MRNLSIFGGQLHLHEDVKYLGVILDSKLNWTKHLESRVKKANAAFVVSRRAVGATWGLTPRSVLWLYTAIIRPMLSYASVVWWPKTLRKSVQGQLSQVQRLACLSVTGAVRTAPTAALEVMLNIPPLDLHIYSEAVAALTALPTTKNNVWRYRTTGHGSTRHRLA